MYFICITILYNGYTFITSTIRMSLTACTYIKPSQRYGGSIKCIYSNGNTCSESSVKMIIKRFLSSYITGFYQASCHCGTIVWLLAAHTSTGCIHRLSLSPPQPQTLPQHYVMHGASLGLPGVALDCT